MSDKKYYYYILGVPYTATKQKILDAHLKYVKAYHSIPRRIQEKEFKEVKKAYTILSDPLTRLLYDRYGLSGLLEPENTNLDAIIYSKVLTSNFADLRFENIKSKPLDTIYDLSVTLDDLYGGKTFYIAYTRRIICIACKGMGGTGTPLLCRDCNGMGGKMVFREVGPGMLQPKHSTCTTCLGDRTIFKLKKKCKVCDGQKIFHPTVVVIVNIEKGMPCNHLIKFSECGDHLDQLEQAGDLIIRLNLQFHKDFQLLGQDILMKMDITLTEALCGFKRVISHLCGRKLLINHNSDLIRPGQIKVIYQKGMPQWEKYKAGDLLIIFNVILPESNFANLEQLSYLECLLHKKLGCVYDIKDEAKYEDDNSAAGADDDQHSVIKVPLIEIPKDDMFFLLKKNFLN